MIEIYVTEHNNALIFLLRYLDMSQAKSEEWIWLKSQNHRKFRLEQFHN